MHTPVLLSLLVFPPMDENLHDTVLALIDHGSEINLMSKEFYRKGK